MNPADRVRLQHMLEAARDAQSFANGRTWEELGEDRMLLMSLERAVEIVGEAASKVYGFCGPTVADRATRITAR